MAYVARPADFHGAAPFKGATTVAPLPAQRHGFWSRLFEHLFDRLREARQRDAEQEVARYMARRGKLTDSIERELADRLMYNRF